VRIRIELDTYVGSAGRRTVFHTAMSHAL
jgi:hypothetical protein